MLRQIHIDKFNKIITQYKPQIFNTLTILQSKPYNQYVEYYIAYDQHQNYYQVYNTDKELESILKDVEFLEKSPKILLIKTDKDFIIIEEKIDENLYQLLITLESKSNPTPYLDEVYARQIVKNLKEGLEDYGKHLVDYNAINPKNIVRRGNNWELSVVGLLVKNQKQSPDYYKSGLKNENKMSYALGTLLFKLLFGFVPFQKKKQRINFTFKDYIKYLDRQQSKKALKIYYFAERLLEVSEKAKQLIEQALQGNMTLPQFYQHQYFDKDNLLGVKKNINPANKQIIMLSLFSMAHQSLTMAAIEHHRKYPQERINPKLIYSYELTKDQIVSHLKKHPILTEVEFDESFKNQKVKQSLRPPSEQLLPIDLQYFEKQQFDPQTDFPCRQIIKIISNMRNEFQSKSQSILNDKQAQIKLYAYPYAMVFQLLKVIKDQPQQIIRKIYRLNQDLLQISQLNYTKLIQPLHKTELIIKQFDQIKIRFRELINDLYKHFLSEAIRKYNAKKDIIKYSEKANTKRIGLEYYRLCLKLMECSLLIRKRGRQLDLPRIETSERKEIQRDLNDLLKQYFPNKIQLN